ncbi:hypothetical protein QJQ45_023222 [Haematococcus lacustris]|nr:hypothetical protein QJQ45_023222 [Haematococcus lacustris]
MSPRSSIANSCTCGDGYASHPTDDSARLVPAARSSQEHIAANRVAASQPPCSIITLAISQSSDKEWQGVQQCSDAGGVAWSLSDGAEEWKSRERQSEAMMETKLGAEARSQEHQRGAAKGRSKVAHPYACVTVHEQQQQQTVVHEQWCKDSSSSVWAAAVGCSPKPSYEIADSPEVLAQLFGRNDAAFKPAPVPADTLFPIQPGHPHRPHWATVLATTMLSISDSYALPTTTSIVWCHYQPDSPSSLPSLLRNFRHNRRTNVFFIPKTMPVNTNSVYYAALTVPSAMGCPEMPLVVVEDDVAFASNFYNHLSNLHKSALALKLAGSHQEFSIDYSSKRQRAAATAADSSGQQQAAAGSSRQQRAAAGSSGQQRAAAGSSRQQRAAAGSSEQQQAAAGSSRQQRAAAGSSGLQRAAAGSSRQQQAAAGSSEQQQAAAGSSGQQRAAVSSSRQQQAAAGSSGQQRAAAGSSRQQRAAAGSSEQQQAAAGSSRQQRAAAGSSGLQRAAAGSSEQQRAAAGSSGHEQAAPSSSEQQQAAAGSSGQQRAAAGREGSHRTPPTPMAKLTTGAAGQSTKASSSAGDRASRLSEAARAYLKPKRGQPQPSIAALAQQFSVPYATLHGVIKRGGVVATRGRPTVLSAVAEQQLRDMVVGAQQQGVGVTKTALLAAVKRTVKATARKGEADPFQGKAPGEKWRQGFKAAFKPWTPMNLTTDMLDAAVQRSAILQPSLRFPAEDRFYFKHEVVARAAKKAVKKSNANVSIVQHTGGASAVFNDKDGKSTRFHMAEDFSVALGLASYRGMVVLQHPWQCQRRATESCNAATSLDATSRRDCLSHRALLV